MEATLTRIRRPKRRKVPRCDALRLLEMTVAKKAAWLAWSSGKDSAWCLHALRQGGEFEVVALLTTVNRTYERVAMHAVRESLLEMQAAAAGLPLVKVPNSVAVPQRDV